MGKLGENVPLIIDKVVDLWRQSGIYGVSEEITSPESRTGRDLEEKAAMFLERLENTTATLSAG
jgi:hypothetical protein